MSLAYSVESMLARPSPTTEVMRAYASAQTGLNDALPLMYSYAHAPPGDVIAHRLTTKHRQHFAGDGYCWLCAHESPSSQSRDVDTRTAATSGDPVQAILRRMPKDEHPVTHDSNIAVGHSALTSSRESERQDGHASGSILAANQTSGKSLTRESHK